MPSKYSRKNRDRRGGHKTSPVSDCNGSIANYKVQEATAIQRAEIKHITKKLARRQHIRFIQEGLKDYEEEQDVSIYWGGEEPETWLEYEPYEEEPDDYDPYHGRYDDSPFIDDWDYGSPFRVQPEYEIVLRADVGKTIRELCEERGLVLL